ncbi:MAG: helix-turn-helix transcriptional regulator, partial [Allobaculum sp.]|nr:helix-turn-helix transcriptional regulator [Allobaculum sp.]
NAQLQQQAGFSGNISTRLKRNQYISLETVEKICCVLDCKVDDIIDFVANEDHE